MASMSGAIRILDGPICSDQSGLPLATCPFTRNVFRNLFSRQTSTTVDDTFSPPICLISQEDHEQDRRAMMLCAGLAAILDAAPPSRIAQHGEGSKRSMWEQGRPDRRYDRRRRRVHFAQSCGEPKSRPPGSLLPGRLSLRSFSPATGCRPAKPGNKKIIILCR